MPKPRLPRHKTDRRHRFSFPEGLIPVILILLMACTKPRIYHQSKWMMGTVVEVTWVGSSPSPPAVKRAYQTIRTIDALMSPNRPESDLYRLNTLAGRGFVTVSPLTCHVIRAGLQVWRETRGAFDISLWPLIHLWGFDTKTPHLPSLKSIQAALKKTGCDKIQCDMVTHRVRLARRGMGVDLGGIAKGFAVDRAVRTLRSGGIKNFIVNAGGDLYCAGRHVNRSWRIGIQDPDHPHAVIAVLPLSNRAIATSGDYENYFIKDKIRYHHILNPATGFPARGLRSVSVLAPNTLMADALATALFVMGRKKAIAWTKRHPVYAAVLVDSALGIWASASLKGLIKWKKRIRNNVKYF